MYRSAEKVCCGKIRQEDGADKQDGRQVPEVPASGIHGKDTITNSLKSYYFGKGVDEDALSEYCCMVVHLSGSDEFEHSCQSQIPISKNIKLATGQLALC